MFENWSYSGKDTARIAGIGGQVGTQLSYQSVRICLATAVIQEEQTGGDPVISRM